MDRIIFHVDMDAFFASVEQLDHPEYRDKPVIVGAQPGKRGVVSAASYEARKFGIHSAMPISQAYRRCPQGIYVRPRGGRYREMSDNVFKVFHEFTPVVEPVSVDEAFLDLTGCCHLHGGIRATAERMKAGIRERTQLTGSIGVAPSRLVAKIASDYDKPDGLTIVTKEGVADFLDPMPIRKIWGIGPKTEEILGKMGIHRVKELRQYPRDVLESKFGEGGLWLHEMARGIDHSEFGEEPASRSVSHETTFEKDTNDLEMVRNTLLELAAMVGRRLRRSGLKGRTVQLTYRDTTFNKRTRNRTLAQATNIDREIFECAESLFKAEDWSDRKIRLIGVGLTNVEESGEIDQLDMFRFHRREKEARMHAAVDEITGKYGSDVMRKGTELM